MDSRSGDKYESRDAALVAGVPEEDVVEVTGSVKAVGRVEHALKTMNYLPGSIILSADKKTRYQVQKDGSWKKISDQEPGEFEEVEGNG